MSNSSLLVQLCNKHQLLYLSLLRFVIACGEYLSIFIFVWNAIPWDKCSSGKFIQQVSSVFRSCGQWSKHSRFCVLYNMWSGICHHGISVRCHELDLLCWGEICMITLYLFTFPWKGTSHLQTVHRRMRLFRFTKDVKPTRELFEERTLTVALYVTLIECIIEEMDSWAFVQL